ncbi:MAG: ATP-binding protein [Actinomycetota bacterium]
MVKRALMNNLYIRDANKTIADRLQEPRQFMQVLLGPRQVGKTTAIQQVLTTINIPSHYASADQPSLQPSDWIEAQWMKARGLVEGNEPAVLVLDEVHKLPEWSSAVKRFWDEDTRDRVPLLVVLLGSSPLLVQRGLTESLAGRFEIISLLQWSFKECKDYFGWNLDRFLFYGGYPGANKLVNNRDRWLHYVRESLIETTISRDVLLTTQINKPALLRQLFDVTCEYSGQIVSYRKMLGQLHDAGNATTLAHYLNLLSGIGFVGGLQKYSGSLIRTKASSPKLQVYDTALMTQRSTRTLEQTKGDSEYWGHLTESAVAAHLMKAAILGHIELFYWREGQDEVDLVVKQDNRLTAIEVKTGSRVKNYNGIKAFRAKYPDSKILLVGAEGIPVEDFLPRNPVSLREML